MFADALLDSHHQSRRGWATVTSFGIQAIAVACLLIVPLFYTQVLPHIRVTPPIVLAPIGDIAQQPVARPTTAGGPSIYTIARNDMLMAPSRVPPGINSNPDIGVPNIVIGTGVGRVGIPDGILGAPETMTRRPLPPPVAEKPPIVSRMMEGSLLHRVEPTYPPVSNSCQNSGHSGP